MRIVLALLLLTGLLACTAQETPTGLANVPPSAQETDTVVDIPAMDDIVEYRIEAFNFGFDPDPIRIKQGEHVRLIFTSREGSHGVAIPEFGVNTGAFGPGEERSVEFVADKAGEFGYRCNVFCGSGHRDMKGLLIVE